MSRIITPSDLSGRSLPELRVLFRKAQETLVRSERGSPERRAALASLESISRAMAHRMSR